MCTSMPWWMPWSCSVRIISRPVRSPTCARRGYLWPPKLRWRMRPSGVRSNSAPHASSSRTRSGASFACSSAMRQLLTYWPPRIVSAKWTCQLSRSSTLRQRRGDAALGHHRVRLAEQRLADQPDARRPRRPPRSPRAGRRRRRRSPGRRARRSGSRPSEDPPVGPDAHRAEPDVDVGERDPEQAHQAHRMWPRLRQLDAVVGAPAHRAAARAGRGTRRPGAAASGSRACSRRAGRR